MLQSGCSIRHNRILASAMDSSGVMKAEYVESKIFSLFSKKHYLQVTNMKSLHVNRDESTLLERVPYSDTTRIKLLWRTDCALSVYIDNNLVQNIFYNKVIEHDK
jgi:hypothetical protein